MKRILLIFAIFSIIAMDIHAQQFTVITQVESIVPAGLGRSRLITHGEDANIAAMTTERTDGKHSEMNKVKRKDLKANNFQETKLLNFFSLTGINFQNIASNDAIVSAKLTEMAANGWELVFVTSAVESNAGVDDGEGIFVTRYIFKKE